VPKGASFAIVAARFNELIVQALVSGARGRAPPARRRSRRDHRRRVPGAWEIPHACARLARSKRFDAIIAVGAVIRGGTPHFDYVGGVRCPRAWRRWPWDTGVVVSFGVLTTDTIEQAVERAGSKGGNKGFDAAVAAIEMVTLGAELSRAGSEHTWEREPAGERPPSRCSSPSKRAADSVPQVLHDFWREFPGDVEGRAYAESLVVGVVASARAWTSAFGRASEHWRLSRMTRVDRNVLSARDVGADPRAVDSPRRHSGRGRGAREAVRDGGQRRVVNGVARRVADECGRTLEADEASSG